MIFMPAQLGKTGISKPELIEDKKRCKRFGPCGVGGKALYLNSFYIDRRYYIPFPCITRVFKRVAMSKGGFSGKGMFATIPYLVVIYDNGLEKQCNFKYEEDVDRLLAYLGKVQSHIKQHSEEAEQRLLLKEKERASRKLPKLTESAENEVKRLKRAAAYLEQEPELSLRLSQTARRKRAFENSRSSYKWTAAAIFLMGLCSLAYGVYSLYHHAGFAIYFTLFGLTAIFMFSGAGIFPTSRNNKRYIMNQARQAAEAMEAYIKRYEDFPLPSCYSHPVVLKRMAESIIQGRAQNRNEALEAVKEELKALNASVEVDQEEYDEVVAIKALFLNENYQ